MKTMNKRKMKKKGNAMVEFIVIIPSIIVFLFFTWEIFQLSMTKINFLKASRYMVWEKADYTGETGGIDPRPANLIYEDTRTIHKLPQDALINLNNKSSIESDDLEIGGVNVILSAMSKIISGALYLSIKNLGLSREGLWESTISYDYPMPGQMINNLIPGGKIIPDTINISETCLLLTDAWNDPNAQDLDPKDGISFGATRDRLSGYWLLGPLDFTQGSISNSVTDLLEYEIDLRWFGTYELCAEKPPRVNLQSVPDRTEES